MLQLSTTEYGNDVQSLSCRALLGKTDYIIYVYIIGWHAQGMMNFVYGRLIENTEDKLRHEIWICILP